MLSRRLVVMASLIAFAGCTSAEPQPSPTATATPSGGGPASAGGNVPSDGRTLTSLGLQHGPSNFAIPATVTPTRQIDQDNVVTLLFAAADGPGVHEYLSQRLSTWGWQVSASSADSLIFAQPGWQGAMTVSATLAGVTLRVVPPS